CILFPMVRPLLFALALLVAATRAAAAQDQTAACAAPDSIIVRGNERISDATIRDVAGLAAESVLGYRPVQDAIRQLFATDQYSDVRVLCEVDPARTGSVLAIVVEERPVLQSVDVVGPEAISGSSVRERVDLAVGRPIDPAAVDRVMQRIDSLYESKGYYLATVRPETTMVAGGAALTFHVSEGNRLAVSGIRVTGNDDVSDETVVDAMTTEPEGFWWWHEGEFDDDVYEADLAERLPQMYASRGFIDFQILDDTLIIDRGRGKALVGVTVSEGPRYRVGDFQVIGNRRFSTEEIQQFYPFVNEDPTLAERVTGLIRRRDVATNVFDRARWEEATQRLQTAYSNEGYIYASIRPIVDRQIAGDSVPIVDLRWEIDERSPAIINRIEIAGNDYTVEACIRDQLVIIPGSVFNQEALIRSYQNIANMGFFETPLPPPDTRTANEAGDVDVIFRVKEKRTGNINFGASVGQGTGIGGFIGLDQPNLFGRCKRGSLQWQYGAYINDFNLSYTDPAIRFSRVSGTINAYRTRSRFIIRDLGRTTRTGGQLQLGFPVPWSRYTRLYASYGGESVRYAGDENDLLGEVIGGCSDCFRSTLGFTGTRDTRIDLPFPTAGVLQSVAAQFTGGPLGGTADYQRYTGEFRAYAPLGQFGGSKPGSQPIKLVIGLSARGGAVFGDPGPFFFTQRFALGGVQFGEQLRGYEEFSITPQGVNPNTDQQRAQRESFGSAFFTTTSEIGIRFNQMVYVNTFFDAGNIWTKPRDFDPTRLIRGAGIGAAVITPFGPLGVDYAYGFDRVDEFGRPDPKWQFHFKLGQIF
ncbi:MAG: outer membrane protein assembly factor BamA, partial [Gemmatimonadaceae bacterium]